VRRLWFVAAVLGALTATASSGAAVKPQTINLLEIDNSFVGTGGFNAQGRTAPAVGQGFVFGSNLYKWNHSKRGAQYGTTQVACTFTSINLAKNTSADICTGVASLPAGQIVVSGLTTQSNSFVIPIVGGTRAYTGAKGYVRIKNIGGSNSGKSVNTIVITG
jgi:hypothetical protein